MGLLDLFGASHKIFQRNGEKGNVFIYLGGKLKTLYLGEGVQVPFFLVQPWDFFKFPSPSSTFEATKLPRPAEMVLKHGHVDHVHSAFFEAGDGERWPVDPAPVNIGLIIDYQHPGTWTNHGVIKHLYPPGWSSKQSLLPGSLTTSPLNIGPNPKKGSRIVCQVPSFSRVELWKFRGGGSTVWQLAFCLQDLTPKPGWFQGTNGFYRMSRLQICPPKKHFRRLSDTNGTLVPSWI